jgi:GTP-binding protein
MVGRSNVGKSSLINALVKRKGIARVSQTPGKTQAVHFYLINEKFYLVDLPGYGFARVAKSVSHAWRALVQSYLDSATDIRVLFQLLDARRTPGEHDRQMHDWTADRGIEERVVLTKSDKLSKTQLIKSRQDAARELGVDAEAVIPASAVTKQGIDQIRREIFARL